VLPELALEHVEVELLDVTTFSIATGDCAIDSRHEPGEPIVVRR
jgi:hypothetical protein